MDINPSSHKQFEIWKLGAPLGRQFPVEYVLIISNTRGLLYSQESFVWVIPLYYIKRVPPSMNNPHIKFPYLPGGKETFHQLPYPVFIGVQGMVVMEKVNMVHKMSNLSQQYRQEVIKLVEDRMSFV